MKNPYKMAVADEEHIRLWRKYARKAKKGDPEAIRLLTESSERIKRNLDAEYWASIRKC